MRKKKDILIGSNAKEPWATEKEIGDYLWDKKLLFDEFTTYAEREFPISFKHRPDFFYFCDFDDKKSVGFIELKITFNFESVMQIINYMGVLYNLKFCYKTLKIEPPRIMARYYDVRAYHIARKLGWWMQLVNINNKNEISIDEACFDSDINEDILITSSSEYKKLKNLVENHVKD